MGTVSVLSTKSKAGKDTKVMIQDKTPRKEIKGVSTVWPVQLFLPVQNTNFAARGIIFSRTRLVIPKVLEKAF